MTNILAGGGNFVHLLEHIGSAAKVWTEDMKKHALDLIPDLISTLDANVRESIGNIDMSTLQKDRDHVLLGLMELKAGTRSFK